MSAMLRAHKSGGPRRVRSLSLESGSSGGSEPGKLTMTQCACQLLSCFHFTGLSFLLSWLVSRLSAHGHVFTPLGLSFLDLVGLPFA
jgi:hypothetical protein